MNDTSNIYSKNDGSILRTSLINIDFHIYK